MGFLLILSTLWITTASPLNTLKGRIPQWKVQQVVTDLDKAKVADVRDMAKKQNKVDTTEPANVKAAVDVALVTKVATPTLEVEPEDNRFAGFADVTKYQILETYEIGGSNPSFLRGEFTHSPHYAAVQFCEVQQVEQPFGLPPLPPECNPDGKAGWVILERDLGSLKILRSSPSSCSSSASSSACSCCTGVERDEQEAEAAAAKAEAEKASRSAPSESRQRSDHAACPPSPVRPRCRLVRPRSAVLAAPASAQQRVNGGKEGTGGGLAFVLFRGDGVHHRRRIVLHGPRAQAPHARRRERRLTLGRYAAAASAAAVMVRSMSASVCARLTNIAS